MEAFELFATIASTIAGIAVALVSELLVSRWRSTKSDLKTLRIADTQAAIEAADINALGSNLVRRLGGTSISSYSSNETVREEFDQAFSAVRAFLAVPEGAEPPPSNETPRSQERDAPGVSSDSWTRLAKARRDLELALRQTVDLGSEPRQFVSLSQMIRTALKQKVLSDAEARRLTESVSTANRAIHGEPVAEDEIEEAIGRIREILARRFEATPAPDRPGDLRRYVVRETDGNDWVVRTTDSVVSRHSSQAAAIDSARDIIRKSGRAGEVVIQGRDGRIRERDSIAKRSAID